MRRISAHILRLRTLFAFERIDNTNNSKFTIKAQEEDALQGAIGGILNIFPCVMKTICSNHGQRIRNGMLC